MAKRAKPEEIIAKLREAEVRLSQGESVAIAAKSIGVTEATGSTNSTLQRAATNLIDGAPYRGSQTREVSVHEIAAPRSTCAIWL